MDGKLRAGSVIGEQLTTKLEIGMVKIHVLMIEFNNGTDSGNS